jgi:hypothetical protein
VLHRDRLDDETKCHDVIGSAQHVGVAEVYLVLTGSDLVMGGFDLEAHLL